MQALLPQPPQACKALLDSNVQEAAQEGITFWLLSYSFLDHHCPACSYCIILFYAEEMLLELAPMNLVIL